MLTPTGRRRSTITKQQVKASLTAFTANIDSKNEHDLYGPMVEALEAKKPAVARGERQVSTSSGMTEEEEIVVRQRIHLSNVLYRADKEANYSELNDGVLLYRIQNELNTEQETNSDDDDEDLTASGASSEAIATPERRRRIPTCTHPPERFHITKKGIDAKRFPHVASYNLENRSKKEIKQLFAAANKKAENMADKAYEEITKSRGF